MRTSVENRPNRTERSAIRCLRDSKTKSTEASAVLPLIVENRDAKLCVLRLVAVDEVEFCLKTGPETDVGDSIRLLPQRSRLPRKVIDRLFVSKRLKRHHPLTGRIALDVPILKVLQIDGKEGLGTL